MATFGPFETGRLLDSRGGATVYEALKEGDRKNRYAVKIFSLERLVSEEGQAPSSELDPLFQDIGTSFTSRVNVQKDAAAGSPAFAPVLAAGHDERGAWYATKFYVRSIEGMLDRLVVLEPPDLFQVVQTVVKAALHLKKTRGRSHGNLKPSNIFIDGTGKPRNSQVVVTDPLPGEAGEAERYEQADLRAIGELIYQLALHREVDFSGGWVILPVEATREWTTLFGGATQKWLDLCNRLLDPGLSIQHFSLEKLDAELAGLKPRQSHAAVLVPAFAGVVVLALVAGYFLFHKATYGTLEVRTDPPGAQVIVTPVAEGGFEDKTLRETNAAPADGSLKLKKEKGQYAIVLAYPGLASQKFQIDLAAGRTTATNLGLVYGGLTVASDPPGAKLQIDGQGPDFPTPFTNRYFRPGAVQLKLQREGYETATLTRDVPTNRSLLPLVVKLNEPPASDVLVEFNSDPPGAEIDLDGTVIGRTPLSKSIKEGNHQFTARMPFLASIDHRVQVRKGQTPAQQFDFPHAILVVDSDPKGAQIFINRQPAGLTPTNLALPAGQAVVQIASEGYDPSDQTITLANNDRRTLNPVLKAKSGFVEVTSDPPGADIADESGLVLGTTSNQTTKIPLAPGPHRLKASYGALGSIERSVQIGAGKTESTSFTFPYGTVAVSVQPADVAALANVRPAGAKPVRSGDAVRQKPNDDVAYTIDAAGYQPVVTNISVAAKQQRTVTVALAKITVPVRLTSDPFGVDFYGNGVKLPEDGLDHRIAWGPTAIVASHRRLGSLTNLASIKLEGGNTVPQFKFDYGTVVLTNLPADVIVKEGGEELVVQPGAPREAFERPGAHVYDLFERGQKVDTLTTNLASGGSVILQSEFTKRAFRNSIGMTLAKIPDLLGPGKDGWVGTYPVTQKQYVALMGSNPSGHASLDAADADYPVENVPWSKAMEFCQKLSQKDRDAGVWRGDYTLPSRDQYLFFAKDTDIKDAVVKTNQPAKVGSKGPNPFGLYDVRGNVWQWLASGAGADKTYIGGAYDSRLPTSLEFGHSEDRAQDYTQADIGFRVLLIPNR